MPAWFTTVFPVVTLLLGAGAAFAREAFMQSRQDRREALARRHERQAAAVDRREDFELQHLVEVHNALRDCVDKMHHLSQAARRRHLRADPSSTEGVEGLREAGEAYWSVQDVVIAQSGFILDEEVRAAMDALLGYLTKTAAGVEFGNEQVDPVEMSSNLDTAYSAITARVRAVYEGRGQATPPELP